jgi:adenylosuccinate lyase
MVAELDEVVRGLRVHPENMQRNLDLGGGLVYSQRVLLALTAAGMARDQAYRIVQAHALAALDRGASFRAGLEGDPDVKRVLPAAALASCFDLAAALRNVDTIFARATRPPAGVSA